MAPWPTKAGRGRKSGDPRKAVAYIRCSKDERLQALGLEAQREAIATWARQYGVEVVAWHQDVLTGATEPADRPGLMAAMADLQASGAGFLVALRRDRIARDTLVAGLIGRAVEQAGGRLVTADGIASGDGPADALLRTVLDAVAQYERAMIRARIKAAMAVKRGRGELLGKAPFGWRGEGEGPGRRLVEDEAEQAVIARARVLRGQGLTVRAVADRLEAEGVVGRAGKPLAFQAVAKLLEKP